MNSSIARLILIVATSCHCASAVDPTPQKALARLEKTLATDQFWGASPATSWTAQDVALLSQLAVSSHDSAVRLRATKVIIDLAGNGDSTPQHAQVVNSAFRYLQEHADQLVLARLLDGPRLTHYTVSTKDDGSVWVLLESICTGANRGGVNLQWDTDREQIVSNKAWGGFVAK